MRAIVVYESVFGNTRAVAHAIAQGLRGRFVVCLSEADKAPTALVGVDLLVVGGPTHTWSMTLGNAQGERIGIREYLGTLPKDGDVLAAIFDTVIRARWLPISKPVADALGALGFRLLVKPEHFFVTDTQGPLEPGELSRAQSWGVGLADAYQRSISGVASQSGR